MPQCEPAEDEPRGNLRARDLQILADLLGALKLRTYELMHIDEGRVVLDIGCGPGSDTIPLAEHVGHTGRVIGIDSDEQAIALAETRAAENGVSDRVHHERGGVSRIPYEDCYFDACRAERLFTHLADCEAALAEILRVTKRGGWVVVAEADQSTRSIDTCEIDIEWRLRRFFADLPRNGYAGRQLHALFRNAGLQQLAIEIHPIRFTDFGRSDYGQYLVRQLDGVGARAVAAGVVSPEELRRYKESLERATAEDRFFGSMNMVVAAGRKP